MIMEWLSEKLTKYIVRTGAVSSELYAVYQYGFQIILEMLSCFLVCLGIALYLHMIPEFFVFTGIFMLIRTYAGGLHLNSFGACFICSVAVQTAILIISNKYVLSLHSAWAALVLGSLLIWWLSPVESINKELDKEDKKHCRKMTVKLLVGTLLLSWGYTLSGAGKMVSLCAMTLIVIVASQSIGIIKYKNKKR